MKLNIILIAVMVFLTACFGASKEPFDLEAIEGGQFVTNSSQVSAANNAPMPANEDSVADETKIKYTSIAGVSNSLHKSFMQFLEVYGSYETNQAEGAADTADRKTYIVSTAPLMQDTLNYANTLGLNTTLSARTRFNYNRALTPNEIRILASYLRIDVVVYKSFFNPEDLIYTYDFVLFQNSTAEQADDPLALLEETNVSGAVIPSDLNWSIFLERQEGAKSTVDDQARLYYNYTKDASLNTEGFWEDIISGEVIEIVKSTRNDQEVADRIYYAYLRSNNNLTQRSLVVNPSLKWEAGNIRFRFSYTGQPESVFINEEKMLATVRVITNPAKRAVLVVMPDRQTKYYIPYLADIPKAIKNKVYEELVLTVKPITYKFAPSNRYTSRFSSTNGVTNFIASYPFAFGVLAIMGVIIGLPSIVP